MPKKGEIEDLTGQKFGRLTVLELDLNLTQAKGRAYWKCRCDCGNMHPVKACYLKNGMQKSCGCYKREIIQNTIEQGCKQNTYVEHSDYYEGFDSKGYSFLFDKEDYPLISQYYWSVDDRGYAGMTQGRQRIKMHILLLPSQKGLVTDHINHNRSDNRKANLRQITPAQNAHNRRFGWKSKTGIQSVHLADSGRFEVVVSAKYIGTYDTLEQALDAREKARKELQSEYQYDPANDTGRTDYKNN